MSKYIAISAAIAMLLIAVVFVIIKINDDNTMRQRCATAEGVLMKDFEGNPKCLLIPQLDLGV